MPRHFENWEHLKIPFEEIKVATGDFQKCIGKDGYGRLYEGQLFINGKHKRIAVKRISEEKGHAYWEFLAEVKLLGDCKHENLITLVGYCDDENKMIIVYEYAEHGSLDRYIRRNDTNHTLSWLERLKIVVGVANGLDHLHNHIKERSSIIHRDIKCSNIFLDDKLVARIANHGMCISHYLNDDDDDGYPDIQGPFGTPGYVDPNYMLTGVLKTKIDVYSFGVVLFEVLCGRLCNVKCIDGITLSGDLVKEYYANGKLDEIIDPNLREQISTNTLSNFSALAYKCLQDQEQRPRIDVVKKELEEMLHFEMQEVMSGRLKSISKTSEDDDECLKKKLPIQRFSSCEINNATNEKALGEGAFGKVYHGNITGKEVAVKRMKITAEQEIQMFQKEIDLLSACDHNNIISLVGYSDDEEDEKILVYEYMSNGSLYDYLFSHHDVITPRLTLTVDQRLEICLGVAKGLDYLHSGTHFNIIHSDIKTENILLDHNLVPKISDFGLSRTRDVGPSTSQVVTNHIKGTEGYLAPECYEPGYKLSRKADVYAFGIVLLEVLCERPPWKRLVLLALPKIIKGELDKLTPQHIKTSVSSECFRECETLIGDCLEIDPDERPSMNKVVYRLEFALELQKQIDYPQSSWDLSRGV